MASITQEIHAMSTPRWHGLTLLLAAAVFVVGALSAHATESWLGTWKIASARVAPWVGKTRRPDTVDRKELVGKTVTITARAIAGPPILSCQSPHYKLSDYSADKLFQGAFSEMRQKDEAVDPAKVAASLGFQGESWQVLETGCANEIDWHFVDGTTAVIGFNDFVYVLKKQ
jgi:hypothetical protein